MLQGTPGQWSSQFGQAHTRMSHGTVWRTVAMENKSNPEHSPRWLITMVTAGVRHLHGDISGQFGWAFFFISFNLFFIIQSIQLSGDVSVLAEWDRLTVHSNPKHTHTCVYVSILLVWDISMVTFLDCFDWHFQLIYSQRLAQALDTRHADVYLIWITGEHCCTVSLSPKPEMI